MAAASAVFLLISRAATATCSMCKSNDNPLLRDELSPLHPRVKRQDPLQITTISCGFGKRQPENVDIDRNYNCIEQNTVTNYGEDASFLYDSPFFAAFSIADGVGGWNRQGIDPSIFSFNLESNILNQLLEDNDATDLLYLTDNSFNKIKSDNTVYGSATLTTLSIDKSQSLLYTSNLGDSGFMLIRSGAIFEQSFPQQHFFNAPYQLANPPKKNTNAARDQPINANFKNMPIKSGDIILAFSDGVSDNLFDYELRELALGKIPSIIDNDNVEDELKELACFILAVARIKSRDTQLYSPFAANARKSGYRFLGGKQDDSSLIISVVH